MLAHAFNLGYATRPYHLSIVVYIAPTQDSIVSIEAIREIYGSTGRVNKGAFLNHFIAFNSRSVFDTLFHGP
ncbi:hypothetical protein EYZ11_009148 [Aspergillus tanneri]|uniref:Uncharacterized protein n=1 Tax=Aspergillus tanneri TaxID=1220188 RepID=A0A4S3J8L6_9EURO|nr:hypothetical protein EYZ11_009148 [Aspergillus tanneri]